MDNYKGINAEDFKKVIDKMIARYGKEIVFEWCGSMRIVDFENNVLNHIR